MQEILTILMRDMNRKSMSCQEKNLCMLRSEGGMMRRPEMMNREEAHSSSRDKLNISKNFGG